LRHASGSIAVETRATIMVTGCRRGTSCRRFPY
jgi:hypothetical protein